jgi:hypothetical protein
MSTLTELAQQLKDNKENIILIYAFNSTGKTRLSVSYKDLTKAINGGKHSGVYFNAYSEDLFVWDNDEEHSNENVSLKIIYSSLNQFHSFLIENPTLINEKLSLYKPKFLFKFNPNPDPEKGIDSVTFFLEENGKPRKISRSEERIFIWCFFLALFEVDAWSGAQGEHFFIDDPVSSLDDHNIFITADSIFNIVEENYLKKRIIITTHHIGLFSILFDRLKKGEKSSKYKNLAKLFILSNKDNKLLLKHHDKDVFLFHLHLLQTLDSAKNNQLYLYHFVLLRQLLENISSFLGSGRVGYILEKIGIEDVEDALNKINSLSHQNAYKLQFNVMSPVEEDLFKNVFQGIQNTYSFKF